MDRVFLIIAFQSLCLTVNKSYFLVRIEKLISGYGTQTMCSAKTAHFQHFIWKNAPAEWQMRDFFGFIHILYLKVRLHHFATAPSYAFMFIYLILAFHFTFLYFTIFSWSMQHFLLFLAIRQQGKLGSVFFSDRQKTKMCNKFNIQWTRHAISSSPKMKHFCTNFFHERCQEKTVV